MGAEEEGLPGKPCSLAQVRDARCGRGSGLGAGEPEQPAGIGGPCPQEAGLPVGRDSGSWVGMQQEPPDLSPGCGVPAPRGLADPPFLPKQLRLCLWLSPFFVTGAAYFLLWIPQDQPSWVGALVKCLPVLCLAGSLQAARGGTGRRVLLQGALLCSAVGDACLIWPDAFLSGERTALGSCGPPAGH